MTHFGQVVGIHPKPTLVRSVPPGMQGRSDSAEPERASHCSSPRTLGGVLAWFLPSVRDSSRRIHSLG